LQTRTLAANANVRSPYYVELHYDDSYSTKSGKILWKVLQAGVTGQISILPVGQQSNTVGDNVTLLIQAHSSLLLQWQLSAQGLPPGLTLAYTPDYYFNGYIPVYITGTLPAATPLNSPYQVKVTARDGLHSASTNFQWQVVPPQPPALPGDFDGNNTVDQTDDGVWRGNFGQSVAPYTFGDGNGDGQVDTAVWVVWRKHLGQTLEGVQRLPSRLRNQRQPRPPCPGVEGDLLVRHFFEDADGFSNGERVSSSSLRRI
jgi:hypothetical protein